MVLLISIEVFSHQVLIAALKFLMYTTSALNSQRSASLCPLNIWINMQHHVGPEFILLRKLCFVSDGIIDVGVILFFILFLSSINVLRENCISLV